MGESVDQLIRFLHEGKVGGELCVNTLSKPRDLSAPTILPRDQASLSDPAHIASPNTHTDGRSRLTSTVSDGS
jgi:hypothetical protein